MSVWVLQQALTAEEEASVTTRTHLQLPYADLPDLTAVTSPARAMQLLRALHPDEPPESLTRRFDAFWNLHSGLHEEDVIAVPLPHRRRVALATVTGRYEYRIGPDGGDLHLIPVSWPLSPLPMRRFRMIRDEFTRPGMQEVTRREARILILSRLPYGYNRFRRLQWVLGALTLLMLLRLVTRGFGLP